MKGVFNNIQNRIKNVTLAIKHGNCTYIILKKIMFDFVVDQINLFSRLIRRVFPMTRLRPILMTSQQTIKWIKHMAW